MPAILSGGAANSLEMLEVEFDAFREETASSFEPYLDDSPMGEGEGDIKKYLVTGGHSLPIENYNPDLHADRVGSYAYQIGPISHGNGVKLHDDTWSDARYKEALVQAGEMGRSAGRLDDQRIVARLTETTTGLLHQWDGVPVLSAAHNYGSATLQPGAPAPSYTTNQTNIYTGSGIGNPGAINTDLYAVMAGMDNLRNDKGIKFGTPAAAEIICFYPSANGPLRQVLEAAFNPISMAGDDTTRQGWQHKVKLVGVTDLTNDNDYYYLRRPRGGASGLRRVNRQSITHQAYRDPKLRMNYWDYVYRNNFVFPGWRFWAKVNN